MAKKETPTDEVMRMYENDLTDSQIIRKLSEEGFSPVQISDAMNQAKIKMEISAGSRSPGLEEFAGFAPSRMRSKAKKEEKEGPGEREIPVPRPTAVSPRQERERLKEPRKTVPAAKPAAQEYEGQAYPYAYPTYQEERARPALETEAIEEIAEEIVNEKWQEIKSKIGDVLEWKEYADRRINSVDERIKRIESSLDRLQTALLSKTSEYERSIKSLGAELSSMEGAFGKVISPLMENVKALGKIKEELKEAKPAKREKSAVKKMAKRVKKS